MNPAQTLLSTVGTSLLSNLRGGPGSAGAPGIARAWELGDWKAVAQFLSGFDGSDRLLGAEINSIHDLVRLPVAVGPADHPHVVAARREEHRLVVREPVRTRGVARVVGAGGDHNAHRLPALWVTRRVVMPPAPPGSRTRRAPEARGGASPRPSRAGRRPCPRLPATP